MNGSTVVAFTFSKGKTKIENAVSLNLHVGADADYTNKISLNVDAMTSKGLGIYGLSVADNKGYYIGRYEAGNDGSDNVIVQKGATVYNNIPWGISMTDATGGAVEKIDTGTGAAGRPNEQPPVR